MKVYICLTCSNKIRVNLLFCGKQLPKDSSKVYGVRCSVGCESLLCRPGRPRSRNCWRLEFAGTRKRLGKISIISCNHSSTRLSFISKKWPLKLMRHRFFLSITDLIDEWWCPLLKFLVYECQAKLFNGW